MQGYKKKKKKKSCGTSFIYREGGLCTNRHPVGFRGTSRETSLHLLKVGFSSVQCTLKGILPAQLHNFCTSWIKLENTLLCLSSPLKWCYFFSLVRDMLLWRGVWAGVSKGSLFSLRAQLSHCLCLLLKLPSFSPLKSCSLP